MAPHDVAAFVIDTLQATPERSFVGVVFYGQDGDAHDGWMVMDRAGYVEALATSPLSPHEAFVVFDEARCRCGSLFPRPIFRSGSIGRIGVVTYGMCLHAGQVTKPPGVDKCANSPGCVHSIENRARDLQGL